MQIDVSIVIPTYNEKENIERMITKIEKILQKNKINGEIIVIDDNSPDGTWKIVKKLQKKYSNLKLIVRKKKLGLGSGVMEGFKIAKGDILGVLDCDFSHPPDKIPLFIKAIREGYDIAIGSRYIAKGGIKGWSKKRIITSKIATLLAKPIANVSDPMSGYFFIKKEVIKNFSLKFKGFKILLEILAKGNYRKVAEIPYTFKERKRGKSKLNYKEIVEYLMQCFYLYLLKLRRCIWKKVRL